MYDLFGTDVNETQLYLSWTQTPSDLEGCTCLHYPQALQVELMLSDGACPVLTLPDQLEAEGYVPQRKLITHSRHTGRFFDERGISSRRAYLQCVLAAKALFSRGHVQFRSDRSGSYYTVLLQATGPIPDNLPAIKYQEMLKDLIASSKVLPPVPALENTPTVAPNLLAQLQDLPAASVARAGAGNSRRPNTL